MPKLLPYYNCFDIPVTVTLTMRELSSITLALSTARDAYEALGKTKHWANGRASDTQRNIDKLRAIEVPHYYAAETYTECSDAIDKAYTANQRIVDSIRR